MEKYEMLKALYDFQAAHAKTISFDEGDYFILYQISAKQRNWWPVINAKGNIGFVPSNYVMKLKVDPNFLLKFLDSSIKSLKQFKEENVNGIIKKDELLQRLIEKKESIEQSIKKLHEQGDGFIENEQNSNSSNVISEGDMNDIKPIQESPSIGTLSIQLNSGSVQDLTSEVSQSTVIISKDANNIAFKENDDAEKCKTKKEDQLPIKENDIKHDLSLPMAGDVNDISALPQDVYNIIDTIRRSTNLSFDSSCEALRVVLTSMEQIFPNVLNPYLEAIAIHVIDKPEIPKELFRETHDARRLQYIFSQLAEFKNDAEQRTWMLFEDEDDIVLFLEELIDILNNADENISCYEMSCDHYQSLVNLVQYYQMETRWRIKRLLLKTFMAASHLDHIIVDILLTSILPLEIVEDMKNNYPDLEKLKELSRMLTIIFSLGQAMPINHQEHLNAQFATFLFDIIEENKSEILTDIIISLILAFNLQFNDFTQNLVMEAMQNMTSAKIFTEKILLLFNRDEDPIKILKHSKGNFNSVLKMLKDLFSLPETAGLFYTNDNKVLIDILVRQLSDLSVGDPMRRHYLELCRRIVRNTNYEEHSHRKQDFMKIFTRIFCEETESSANDQQLVRDIANEFPHIFKA